MKRKKTGNRDVQTEAPSPEFKAFEEATKRILKVPKKELDRREAEARKRE